MFYPLIFKPVFKDYIWGGRKLANFGKTLPDEGTVAESWEISSHPDGESIVAYGEFSGQTLTSLVKRFGHTLVGSALPPEKIAKFPLLVKFIDARDMLSVQVHPDDAFAFANENCELGKNEMWYIMDALPGSKIVYDVIPGTSRESFANAVSSNQIDTCLNYLPVKPGDFIDIPAGLVHAIGSGIVLAEIQQNSNTTYRVYDYDRTDSAGNPRPLHISKALDVIDFSTSEHPGLGVSSPVEVSPSLTMFPLVSNSYFCVEKLLLSGSFTLNADGTRFFIYIVLDGNGEITSPTSQFSPLKLSIGTSVLIPASLGEYTLQGEMTLLKSFVP